MIKQDSNCIFCKIIAGEIPATKVYEDDNMIIIKEIKPIAPIHYLLIVKSHYAHLVNQTKKQSHVLGECLHTVGQIKDKIGLQDGFRLIVNQGGPDFQMVQHLHVHIVGGKKLNWETL